MKLLSYVLATAKVTSGLVTVRTHGYFIVLPNSETMPPAPCTDIPLSHIILSPYPSNAERLARKRQVSIISHWFDSTRVPTRDVQILRSPATRDGCSTHSAIPFGVLLNSNR